ncbi:MAG TPA: A24 family peptidase [Chloroflexota bacterium]|nr:A24 family peptidase [Chloroflexota bacterium]
MLVPQETLLHLVQLAVVGIVMAIATVTDLRERRVPLWLTAPGIATALALAALTSARVPPLPGALDLPQSAIGLVVGVLVLAPFVLLGGIGAGDALLLGVVGAWLGWAFVLWTAWWASLAGGALALVALARKQRTFPYVPALALGLIGAALFPLGIGRA